MRMFITMLLLAVAVGLLVWQIVDVTRELLRLRYGKKGGKR